MSSKGIYCPECGESTHNARFIPRVPIRNVKEDVVAYVLPAIKCLDCGHVWGIKDEWGVLI